MSNDRKLSDNPQTCIHVSITINPGQDTRGDLAGLLGNFAFDLGEAVALSRQTSSKANVVMIEKVTNVLERDDPLEGELKVAFSMVDDEVAVDVSAPRALADDAWFALGASSTPKEQLAESVRQRRLERAKSGFDFARVRPESKKKPPDSSGGMSGAPAVLAFVPLRKKS